MERGGNRSMVGRAWVLIGLCGLGGIAGCQQYSTYPAVESSQGMAESPNKPAIEAVMVGALQYVATRYPPGGPTYQAQDPSGSTVVEFPIVVNLPIGMRKSYYERIAKKVGPNVQPMSAAVVDRAELPVYHITRVWLRFNQGTVDVLRPMPEMGKGPDGKPVYQKVTVRFEGGFEPWRVVHARAWEPGTDAAPEPYFVPDVERVDQYEYSMKQREAKSQTQADGTPDQTAAPTAGATPTKDE